MTPDLFEEGTVRLATHHARVGADVNSGDRQAGYGRVHEPGSLDLTHGRILYLEDVHVSFDGFKAINGLSLDIAPG
jgi:urea transport system ATP-binding protein